MEKTLKNSERDFFSNPARKEYKARVDQKLWLDKCVEGLEETIGYLKKGLNLNQNDGEIFNALVYEKLGGIRKKIAEDVGQNSVFFGTVRDPFIGFSFGVRFERPGDFEKMFRLVETNLNEAKKNYSDVVDYHHLAKSNGTKYSIDEFDIKYKFLGTNFEIESTRVQEDEDVLQGLRISYPDNVDNRKFKNKVGGLIRESLEWKKDEGVEKLYDNMAKLKWNLVVATYFTKGNSAIADMLEAAIYKHHDIAIFPRKDDFVSRDVKCFLYPHEDIYAKDYLKDFKIPPTPVEQIGRPFLLKAQRILSQNYLG